MIASYYRKYLPLPTTYSTVPTVVGMLAVHLASPSPSGFFNTCHIAPVDDSYLTQDYSVYEYLGWFAMMALDLGCLVRVQCERDICLQDANLSHEPRAVELT